MEPRECGRQRADVAAVQFLLAVEQRTGISLERLREIASAVLHAGDGEQQ